MNSNAHPERNAGGFAEPEEEELEFGEPISDVETPMPAAPKIAALRGAFSGTPRSQRAASEAPPNPNPGESAGGGSFGGQVVLASAKHLKNQPEDPAVRGANERRQQKEKTESNEGRGPERSVFSGGVLGGTVAMLVAVFWFLAGLANDVIFFYPPILFVIGLCAFFKGFMRRE